MIVKQDHEQNDRCHFQSFFNLAFAGGDNCLSLQVLMSLLVTQTILKLKFKTNELQMVRNQSQFFLLVTTLLNFVCQSVSQQMALEMWNLVLMR